MKRKILTLCMAMCMTASMVVAGPLGSGITAFAADGETGTAEAQKTVTISAYDYTAVEGGVKGASETGVIMEQKETVDAGMSTADVISKAFADAGVSVEGVANGYVSSINGLASGAGYSGWMMSYNNDDYSNWGISSVTLNDGDVLRFDYTNNTDTTTDDIGNGYYGNPYVSSLTVAGQTMAMSKETDATTWPATSTYYIDGEKTDATGTKDDPFVFEVEIPVNETAAVPVTVTTSLNSHYAVIDGWSVSKDTYDLTNGLDFSVSSLGGKYKSYFRIDTKPAPNNLSDTYSEKLDKTVEYLRTATENPVFGSEWNVMTLARYGYKDTEWYTKYYKNVVDYIENKGSSKLDVNKSTENSRLILALSAIGADVTNVAGYNLLLPLADMTFVKKQGINGSVYALIALDTGKYDIPKLPEGSTGVQTTREGLIQEILSKKIATGGWAYYGSTADPDMTCMAIQALAPYYNTNDDVKAAVDEGLKAMSAQQKDNGGFASWGSVNTESCAQVVCALADLGLDADTYADLVKNQNSVLDAMLSFYAGEGGGFLHVANTKVNMMASQQAGYALVAYDRYKNGKNTLYDMSDAEVLYTVDTSAPSLDKARVIIAADEIIADGTAKEPDVEVYYGDIKLTEGKDYTKEFSDNTEVGTAKVTITAMGDYVGGTEKTFSIYAAKLTEDNVELKPDQVIEWNGTAQKPEVVVSYNGQILVQGEDYTVTYSSNTNAGTGKIKVSGTGIYTGTVEKEFEIAALDMSKVTVTVNPQETEWTGSAVTPSVTVKYNNRTLRKNSDYTLSITDNVKAGTAKVTITAKSANLKGSKVVTFEILPIDINRESIEAAADTDNFEYDGSEKKLDIVVTDGETKLVEGTDYTVSYEDNIELGTARAIITGKGNYRGSREIEFEIVAYDLENAELSVEPEMYVYSGKECKPAVKVIAGEKTLVAGKDYTVSYEDCVNAGTATVRVEGIDHYTGVIEDTYDINEADMSDVDVKLDADKLVWTGKAQMPAVRVTYNGQVLNADSDYTLTVSDNVGVGTARIVISAKSSNFTGSKEVVFSIQAVDINSESVKVSVNTGSFKYDGAEKKPEVRITHGAAVLEEGKDYVVSYSNNVKAGTATITITGKGTYKGTVKKTFVVTSDNISAAKVTLGKSEYVYDGKSKTPSVTVVMNGKTLVNSQDYRISYKNNTEAGKASVVIEGVNNYSGSVVKTFDIRDMSVSITGLSSNGSKVSLAWKSAQKADRYELYRKASNEKAYKKISSTKNTSYDDRSVKTGVTYAYKVKAVNGSLTGVTGISRVAVLKSIKATAVNTASGMQISWSKAAGAKQYKVFRKAGSSAWKTVAVTAAVKYVDRTAKNGVSYTYVVKAVSANAVGAGQAVTAYRLTREEIASVSSPTKAVIEVKYNKNSKATGYQVQYSLNKSFKGAKTGTAASNKKTTIRVKTAKAGARYYVRVRAYKKTGKTVYYGPWSNVSNIVVEKD